MEIEKFGHYKNDNELTDILNEDLNIRASKSTYRRLINRLKSLDNTTQLHQRYPNNGPPSGIWFQDSSSMNDESSDEENEMNAEHAAGDTEQSNVNTDIETSNNVHEVTVDGRQRRRKTSEIIDTFMEYAKEGCKALQVPGIAFALITRGKIVYEDGIGYANDSKQKVTSNTRWPIGECTHSFIAALAAKLVEEGKLDWNEPICTYLPEFSLKDDLAAKYTNLIDLLACRIGIPFNELLIADLYPKVGVQTQDWLEKHTPSLVAERLKYISADGLFRTHSLPNYLMYITVIHVIEHITKSNWKDLVDESILKPLKLKHTTAHSKKAGRKDVIAKGYSFDALEGQGKSKQLEDLQPSYSAYSASKGMYSTVHDMAEWITSLMYMDSPRSDPDRLRPITRETLAEYIFTGHSVSNSSREQHFSVPLQGLGWTVHSYKEHDVCCSYSDFAGVTTACVIAPSEGCGVVLFTNQQSSPLCRHLPWFAMDLLLNERPTHRCATFKTLAADRAESQRAEARSKSALAGANGPNLASECDFVGPYHNELFGIAHVESHSVAPGRPTSLRMKLGLLQGKLQPNSVLGYIWELEEAAQKVLGYRLPHLCSVRLLNNVPQEASQEQYLSLTCMKYGTLEPIDKPLYFRRKLTS